MQSYLYNAKEKMKEATKKFKQDAQEMMSNV